MKNRSFARLRHTGGLVAVGVTLLAFATPSIAQINVLISGGFSTAYEQLLLEFEKATGITVTPGPAHRRVQGSRRSPRNCSAAYPRMS